MEWWQWVLVLSLLFNVLGLVLGCFIVSGLAQIIQRQKDLNLSQQTLSDQMADIEEQNAETKADIRKVSQYFVNFAKGLKGVNKGQWYDGM